MKFRIFFFLIIIALSSNSYAQWWVDGGNVIWPHGNVDITNGDLTLTGDLTMTGAASITGDVTVSGDLSAHNITIDTSITLTGGKFKEWANLRVIGAASVNVNNVDYDWSIYRNDLDSSVAVIHWDSTGNAFLVSFGTVADLGYHIVLPTRTIALIKKSSTFTVSMAMVDHVVDVTYGDCIRYRFFDFASGQTQLTETEIDLAYFDIVADFVPNNLPEQQYVSSD